MSNSEQKQISTKEKIAKFEALIHKVNNSVNNKPPNVQNHKPLNVQIPKPIPEESSNSDISRRWKTVFRNPQIIGNGDVQIFLKTRSGAPIDTVDDKLYSFIKYNLIHRVTGDFLKNHRFIIARVSVLNYETMQEIEKNRVEAGISKGSDGVYEATSKIRFMEISYDQKLQKFTRRFVMRASYFASGNLNDPFLVKMSPPFKVCARKRNLKKSKRRSLVFVEDPLSKKTKSHKRDSQKQRMPEPDMDLLQNPVQRLSKEFGQERIEKLITQIDNNSRNISHPETRKSKDLQVLMTLFNENEVMSNYSSFLELLNSEYSSNTTAINLQKEKRLSEEELFRYFDQSANIDTE